MNNSLRMIAPGVLMIALAACGGGSGNDAGSGGGVGQVGQSAYLYVTAADPQLRAVPGTVYQYQANTDGSLAALGTAPLSAGVDPVAIVSDPAGHYVYVVNQGDASISQYAVGTGGMLAALSPATVSIGGPSSPVVPHSASVDPSGHFLYVVITTPSFVPSASIAQYAIGSNGTLTPLSPTYLNVPASAAGPLAIDTSGQHAYLAGAAPGQGGLVSEFSVASNGTLSPLTPASVSASASTIGVTIAPGSRTAYVLSACVDNSCAGQVARYSVGSTGALTSTGATTLTGGHVNPVAMVMDGAGSNAYLLTNLMGVDTNQGAVYQYTIDGTGALKPNSPASLDIASGAVAVSTDGRNLYALSANALGAVGPGRPEGGHVDHFAISSGGLLSAAGGTSMAVGTPTAMTLVVAQ